MDIIWGCLDAGVVRVLRVKIQRFWDTSSINLCGHFIGLRKSLAFPFPKSFINYPPTTESLFCFLQEKKKKKKEKKERLLVYVFLSSLVEKDLYTTDKDSQY
jgi:hypothetical protein